jgi:hypothetical protein
MKTIHSEKALKTIALMGTKPADWHITPIKWVKEMRLVEGTKTCPDCKGNKLVRIDAEGKVIPAPDTTTNEGYYAWQEYMRLARTERNNYYRHDGCPTCVKYTRRFGSVSQGVVKAMVMAEVVVGYPQFPKDVSFDSRFHNYRVGASVCQLCSKSIKSHMVVPVNTDGAGAHAMYVGRDCAKKFLSVDFKFPKNSVMEPNKAQ